MPSNLLQGSEDNFPLLFLNIWKNPYICLKGKIDIPSKHTHKKEANTVFLEFREATREISLVNISIKYL
jgi:hypothetical protein